MVVPYLSFTRAHAAHAPKVDVIVASRVALIGVKDGHCLEREEQLLEVTTLPTVHHVQQPVELVATLSEQKTTIRCRSIIPCV